MKAQTADPQQFYVNSQAFGAANRDPQGFIPWSALSVMAMHNETGMLWALADTVADRRERKIRRGTHGTEAAQRTVAQPKDILRWAIRQQLLSVRKMRDAFATYPWAGVEHGQASAQG